MTNPDPSHLSDAIDAASKEAARVEALRVHPSEARRAIRWPRYVAVALAIAAALLGYKLRTLTLPPGPSQVERDLGQTVALAKQSIEEARKRTGQLPPSLPNASLAAVVQYEPDRGTYRLVATMMGVRVTLERDGSRKTERDIPQ